MTTTSSDPKSILVRFAAGAIPAAAAVILILWHALRPIVGPDHQGFVFIAAGALIAISLGVWCWCVVHSVAAPFATRNNTADQLQEELRQQAADNHAETAHEIRNLSRAVQAGHKRLAAIEKRLDTADTQRDEITAEVEHLRKLILHDNLTTLGEERLGPRPLH